MRFGEEWGEGEVNRMDDLISRQGMCDSLNKYRIEKMLEGKDVSLVWECIDKVLQEPSARSELIWCKDCKHKPHPSDSYDHNKRDCGFEIIFPDYRCPCRCEDEFYNHIPDDDWFCGNAERREDE